MFDFRLVLTFILFLQCYASGHSCKLLFQPQTFAEQALQSYPEIKQQTWYPEIARLLTVSDPLSRNSRFSGEPNLVQLSEQVIALAKSPVSATQKNKSLAKIADLFAVFDIFQNTYMTDYESKLFLKSLVSNPAALPYLHIIGQQAGLRYDFHQAAIDVFMKSESEITTMKELDPQTEEFKAAAKHFLKQLPALIEQRILDQKNELLASRKAEHDKQKKIEAAEKLEQRIRKNIETRYKKTIEKKIPDAALRRQIDLQFSNLYNPRFAEILEKLTRYDWFMKQAADKQNIILYMLNGMVVKAYASTNESHQALLTHTINFIVNGYFPVVINRILNAAGKAHIEFIEINSDEFIRLNTGDPVSDPTLINKAADYLAHEVSHTISGQRVEESYNYFIEEFRAFQVGHFAATGKLMTDREALRVALDLLTNKFYSTAYDYIRRDFLKSFESSDYKYFFRLFDLDSVSFCNKIQNGQLTEREIETLIQRASDTRVAPQLGWPGFITNSPKPGSNSRYLQLEILRQ